MKWVDPDIKLIASAVSDWKDDWVERTRLLIEQTVDLIDYLALHWYIGNPDNDFKAYMSISEVLENRLTAYEGLIQAVSLERNIKRPVHIAIDEWNVWYRTHPQYGTLPGENKLEEIYNLEDALAVAIQLNVFIRHSNRVKMANIAQLVNVIAPIFTRPEGLVLQTIFFPFEIYRRTCGSFSLDLRWEGDTFSGGGYANIRTLDVSATLDEKQKRIAVYVVNRSRSQEIPTEVRLTEGNFNSRVTVYTVDGPDIKAENTFDNPNEVGLTEKKLTANGNILNYSFKPHSITALIVSIL